MSSAIKVSRTEDMVALPSWFIPGDRHVMCAKGKQAKQHAANQLLQSLVEQHLKEYSECSSKLDRSFIVSSILKIIRNGGEGGFVRKMNGTWFDVGDRNAREKIGQAFRDRLSHMFKSSAKAKASIRRYQSTEDSKEESSVVPVASIRGVCCHPSLTFSSILHNETFVPHAEDVDLRDLEPLPLSEAIGLDMNLPHCTNGPEGSTLQEAIHEMYQSHFSSSSEDSFVGF